MRYGNGKSCGQLPFERLCSRLSSRAFSQTELSHPWLQLLSSSAVRLFIHGASCDVRSVLVEEEWNERVSLIPEDYLHGVITVINELVRIHHSLCSSVYESDGQSRLAVNAVTLGDFEAPLRISVFAKEVFTGFSMVCEILWPSPNSRSTVGLVEPQK